MIADAPPAVNAPRDSRDSRSPRALIVMWLVVAALIGWLVAVQAHPGSTEGLIVAGVLGVAIIATLALVPPDRLGRSAKLVVPIVLGVVAIGLWNPWHLAAVSLVLAHPFIGLLTVAGLAIRLGNHRWQRGDASWLIGVVVGVSVVALVVGFLAAGAGFGFVMPGGYAEPYTRGSEDGLRLDQHDVNENGRCRAVVLRNGSGITMRERVLVSTCYPSAEILNDHLVAELCDTSPARVTRLTASTLTRSTTWGRQKSVTAGAERSGTRAVPAAVQERSMDGEWRAWREELTRLHGRDPPEQRHLTGITPGQYPALDAACHVPERRFDGAPLDGTIPKAFREFAVGVNLLGRAYNVSGHRGGDSAQTTHAMVPDVVGGDRMLGAGRDGMLS